MTRNARPPTEPPTIGPIFFDLTDSVTPGVDVGPAEDVESITLVDENAVDNVATDVVEEMLLDEEETSISPTKSLNPRLAA
jgi:hypothetical protein